MLLNLLAILIIITFIPAIFYLYWYGAVLVFHFMYKLGGLGDHPMAQALLDKLVYHFRTVMVVYFTLEVVIYYYTKHQPFSGG